MNSVTGNRIKPLIALNWKDVRHLELNLHCTRVELDKIITDPERHYRFQSREDKRGKVRKLCTPTGRLRRILDVLQEWLQRIQLPPSVHGGVRGRSNISNADCHLGAHNLVKLDIQDCFPSISHSRIYHLFSKDLGCSPSVSRYLTRMTTINGSLPMGSPTSPILAALVTANLAKRMDGLARSRGGRASIYVDDISLSGTRGVRRLQSKAEKIMHQEGFTPKESKSITLHKHDIKIVTGVRVDGGRDVPPEMIRDIKKNLDECSIGINAGAISTNDILRIKQSLSGKIAYVRRLNLGAAKLLHHRFSQVFGLSQ